MIKYMVIASTLMFGSSSLLYSGLSWSKPVQMNSCEVETSKQSAEKQLSANDLKLEEIGKEFDSFLKTIDSKFCTSREGFEDQIERSFKKNIGDFEQFPSLNKIIRDGVLARDVVFQSKFEDLIKQKFSKFVDDMCKEKKLS